MEEPIEEEQNEDEDEFAELENINEKEVAEAIGEDIGEEFEEEAKKDEGHKEEIEETPIEEEINEKKEEIKDSNSNEIQKTLGNVLNINWEELKKSKAKVTVTIDFGG